MSKKKSRGETARRLFTVAITVILITSVFVPGTAAAASTPHCSEVDEFFWVLTIGLTNGHCDSAELSDAVADLEQDMQNQSKTNIYSTGTQVDAGNTQFLNAVDNNLESSRTVAMSRAEAAAVEEIDAGGTKSEVQTAAQEAVQAYYTTKQINLIDRWNTDVETVKTMQNSSEESGLDDAFVRPYPYEFADPDGGNSHVEQHIVGTGTEQLTLVNGTNYISRTYQIEGAFIDNSDGGQLNSYGPGTMGILDADTSMHDKDDQNPPEGIETAAFDTTASNRIKDFSEYKTLYNDIESQSSQMQTNAQEYAGSLYEAEQNGTVDLADHVSGATLAQEYSTEYNSTGYFSYAVGYAAASGLATPDMNASAVMTIQTAQGEYEGLIMSQEAPDNGTFETGVTYNAANLNGSQFVATTESSPTSPNEVVELTGEFTITEMLDEQGNQVESTTVEKIEYETTNASAEYAELQETIRALQTEIQEDDHFGSGGGGDGDGGLGLDLGLGGFNLQTIALIALAAIVLLREN